MIKLNLSKEQFDGLVIFFNTKQYENDTYRKLVLLKMAEIADNDTGKITDENYEIAIEKFEEWFNKNKQK